MAGRKSVARASSRPPAGLMQSAALDLKGEHRHSVRGTPADLHHDFGRIPIDSTSTAEREADHVAEQVIDAPDRRGRAVSGAGSNGPTASPAAGERLDSAGEPLDSRVRTFMESRLGHDFSRVRVHTGRQAAEVAANMGARAFTVDRHIAFAAGEYAPDTEPGMHLLAHELIHVVQQRRAPGTSPRIQKQETKGTKKAKKINKELADEEVMNALDAADVQFLLKQHFSKNILRDLSIDGKPKKKWLTLLAAGQLAFTYGMLKKRNDYRVERKKHRGNKAKMPADMVDPDAIAKTIDPEKQAALLTDLKKSAQPFFDKMLELGWIDTGPEAAQMPDQLLAAVGDARNGSIGIAGGSNVGIGYFMYSNETPKTEDVQTNTIDIAFPPGGPLKVRISAYGFDTEKFSSSLTVTMLKRGTDGKKDLRLARFDFHKKKGLHTKTDMTVSDQKDDVSIIEADAGAEITIPAEPYATGSSSITFITRSSSPAGVTGHDELQVQFSTTGTIAMPHKTTETKKTDTGKEEPVGAEVAIEGVYFDFDKATLRPESSVPLDHVVSVLKERPTMKIEIDGHTDSRGSAEDNQKLSEERARAVLEYLVAHGIDEKRLTSKGFGETMPIHSDAEIAAMKSEEREAAHQRNRRVMYKILQK
jgi:outer membrane protein OmpA-like peptidoglycan-associated protein